VRSRLGRRERWLRGGPRFGGVHDLLHGRLRQFALPRGRLPLAAAAFGSAFAIALCIGGFSPWVWSAAGPGSWVASVYAGVGPMAGGFLLWGLAMSGGRANRLAPLGYATPLLSTALLVLFGETTLQPGALLGALLVLVCSIGVLAIDRKERG
jgi:drug/metabolite transporter (DMT)-like permease